MPTALMSPHFYSTKKSIIFYIVMFSITLISVLLIDRHLADFIHQQHFANSFTKLLSNSPLLLEAMALMVIVSCIIARVRDKLSWLAIHLLLTIILASVIRFTAKWLFGRTWPQTWIDNNPSWITDRIEGFQPFAAGIAYNSFPSGHSLFTFALTSVFWYHLPHFRPLWIAMMSAVFIGQLAQNFHYLGDLLAGASIGILCAQLTISLSQKFNQ